MCTSDGFIAITAHLGTLSPDRTDALREALCIGVHSQVEITDPPAAQTVRVTQAFCSALPVAYSAVPAARWAPFASLVLEAAYEAALWAAVLNSKRTGCNTVMLTRLGGGVFGNPGDWIDAAMRRAFRLAIGVDLDVRLVSFEPPSREILELAAEFG